MKQELSCPQTESWPYPDRCCEWTLLDMELHWSMWRLNGWLSPTVDYVKSPLNRCLSTSSLFGKDGCAAMPREQSDWPTGVPVERDELPDLADLADEADFGVIDLPYGHRDAIAPPSRMNDTPTPPATHQLPSGRHAYLPIGNAHELRVVDPVTGGEKGSKPERYDLIPFDALDEVARVYGFGAGKYEAHNWAKGYKWGLCLAAMVRHISLWAMVEDNDKESGLNHMAHVAWHCLTLLAFAKRKLGTDDRWRK